MQLPNCQHLGAHCQPQKLIASQKQLASCTQLTSYSAELPYPFMIAKLSYTGHSNLKSYNGISVCFDS